MTKLFYKWNDANQRFDVYAGAEQNPKANLLAALALFQEFQGLSDEVRDKLVAGAPGYGILPGMFPDLATMDTYVEEEVWRIQDILDTEHYATVQAPLNVADHDYFLPEAVESVSHEEIGNEAILAIDAVGGGTPDPNDPLTNTYWQSQQAGLRVLTFRLRSYPKTLKGVRFRTNNGDGRSQLQGVTIKAAKQISGLDTNVVASGVNLDDSSGWFEITFASPKFNARYIQVEASTSLHTNPDHLRIRAIQGVVGVTNHNK